MADPNLLYKSIASARTEAQEEDQDEVPIRNFMPMPYENIVDLVRRDLKVSEERFSNETLEEFVRKQNEKAWTENLKNVTAQPIVKAEQFMQKTYQWECRRLAGFPRVEKSSRPAKANVGTLLNIYSVVQKIPRPVWQALTGRDEDLSEIKAAQLGVLTKDQLNDTEWKPKVTSTPNKITWTFSRDVNEEEEEEEEEERPKKTKIPKNVEVAPAVARSAKPQVKKIGVDLKNLEDRKFGAYLNKVTDINKDFREIATSKILHMPKKLGIQFPDTLNADDFNLIGGIEINEKKYDTQILTCLQIIFNEFRRKGLELVNTLPDLTNLRNAMRGRRFGERSQNLLSTAAQKVFEGAENKTMEEIDERRRVHGKQLWVVKDDMVKGLLWTKDYDKTRWPEWFFREFNTNINTANLSEEFKVKTSTPPFSDDATIKEQIDEMLDAKNGLYFEVCHVEDDPQLTLMLNLLGMIIYGSEKLFAVSNIAPALPSEADNFDTSLWRGDKYGPRLVPEPSTLYDLERYLGYQKSFDLRMNTMKSEAKEPTVSLSRLYHLEGDFPDSFHLPPVYRLISLDIPRKAKDDTVTLDLDTLLWQDDFMFFNDTWFNTKINKDDSFLRGLDKLAQTELLYSQYTGSEAYQVKKGEYQFFRGNKEPPLPIVEAFEVTNYDRSRVDGIASANQFIDKNPHFKSSRFRNGTLAPRLLHYEMVRFLPNLKEIRTMCALLLDYKDTKFEVKFRKSAIQGGEVEGGDIDEGRGGDIEGGSVCSRTSDMSEMIRRLKDDIRGGSLSERSLEPIVEMEIDIGVEAGFSSDII